MEPDAALLGRLLAFAALLASTIEYCEIVKRRCAVRSEAALWEECADLGLRALVRICLLDDAKPRVARRGDGVDVRQLLGRSDRPPRLPDRLTRPIIAPAVLRSGGA